jgi:hypothetical protein
MKKLNKVLKFEIGKSYEGVGEVRGVDFFLKLRSGDTCLFERSDGCYEIIELRQQKASTQMIAGNEVEFKEKEVYGSGESWDGKCFTKLENALECYEKRISR